MVVLAPEERAPEDLVERASGDAEADVDDFEERVVTVEAGEAPAASTLTFMRFGVLWTYSLGSAPRGTTRKLGRCPRERDVVEPARPGRAEAVDPCCLPRAAALDEIFCSRG